MSNVDSKFATRIKSLRVENNLSGEELGKIVGVSKVSVWQWENGINYPNNNVLIELSNYFQVSTDYLLGKSDVRNINNPDIDESSFKVAFYNEVEDLSDDMKEQVLDYVRYLRNKNKK